MKTITGILLLTLLSTAAQSQRICGSDDYTRQLAASDPAIATSIDNAEKQIINTLKGGRQHRDTLSNELINIPVVIHILYQTAAQNISDAQIRSQIDVLNKDFANTNDDAANRPAVFNALAADTRIHFCIAQVGPDGKATTGILRKQTGTAVFTADDAMKSSLSGGDNPWDCTKYLNIWVCNLGGRSLGYASLPGGPADKDGVVISSDVFGTVGYVRAPFNKGRTATHEIGHWLGIKHVWGDTDCGDDGVDDTPRQKTYNFGCPSFPHVTECSQTADGDMFMNFMDFSDDACMNMFTLGQKKRMRALFASGNLRNSFLNSTACDSSLVQGAPLPADTTTTVAVQNRDAYKVYPNPVQSVLTIEYKPADQLVVKSFSIFNAMGTKVIGGEISKEKNSINLSQLTPGVYVVRIGEGKNYFTSKLIKQ